MIYNFNYAMTVAKELDEGIHEFNENDVEILYTAFDSDQKKSVILGGLNEEGLLVLMDTIFTTLKDKYNMKFQTAVSAFVVKLFDFHNKRNTKVKFVESGEFEKTDIDELAK